MRNRAEGLLVDLQTWNPEQYKKLMRKGHKKALEEMAELIAQNQEHAHQMKQAILEQMSAGKPKTPQEARQDEALARMIAQEMAQEEISNLY